MLEKNNLIVIYGKAGSYKSSLGVSLINNYENSCYINLENNKHIEINNSVKVVNEVVSHDFAGRAFASEGISDELKIFFQRFFTSYNSSK